MKRKILYVITKANWGGAQRYVFDLASNLPKEEFEVHVAFGQRGALADKLEAAGITTHTITSLQRDVSFWSDIKSFSELKRLFKTVHPDIVHLNSSKAGGVGALAARIAGIHTIVFTAHGWPFREHRSRVILGILWCMSWITALLSTKVICVSNRDLTQARKMPFVGKKAVRIYNGIDLHMQFGSGEKVRNAFPVGAHITGTIGELNKNKNQQTLIEQAKNNPSMYVAIVGEGEDRQKLEDRIHEENLESRVKLFGFLPANEALKGFDTFALPSLKEGLPYVLLEAKLAGLPITANRVGGVGEILDAENMELFSLSRMLEETGKLYQQ